MTNEKWHDKQLHTIEEHIGILEQLLQLIHKEAKLEQYNEYRYQITRLSLVWSYLVISFKVDINKYLTQSKWFNNYVCKWCDVMKQLLHDIKTKHKLYYNN